MADRINITFEIQPSFYMKTDPQSFQELIEITLDESAEELLQAIKDECPVRTGNLRDGHYIQKGNNWINIKNDVYYWRYVVFRGNDYLNRGLLQFIESQIIEEKFLEKMHRLNI